jgi:hypothetical protein
MTKNHQHYEILSLFYFQKAQSKGGIPCQTRFKKHRVPCSNPPPYENFPAKKLQHKPSALIENGAVLCLEPPIPPEYNNSKQCNRLSSPSPQQQLSFRLKNASVCSLLSHVFFFRVFSQNCLWTSQKAFTFVSSNRETWLGWAN